MLKKKGEANQIASPFSSQPDSAGPFEQHRYYGNASMLMKNLKEPVC